MNDDATKCIEQAQAYLDQILAFEQSNEELTRSVEQNVASIRILKELRSALLSHALRLELEE